MSLDSADLATVRTTPVAQGLASPNQALRPHITVRGLSKRFGAAVVYDRFDLDIPRGAFVSIFGPNGCGKSTIINMVAGLIPRDAGEVLFDGKTLAQTKVGYVFQNYREALFPWMSALSNIEYPLALMGVGKRERAERARALVDHLGVKIDLSAYPYTMSGGQQQLVSIMRALIIDPEVLFLDEPFSALDFEMTLFVRETLLRVFDERRMTTVLVSHDLEEAIYLADYLLLLSRRPTHIVDYAAVPCARPRNDATLSDPAFVAFKSRCLAQFQAEVRKP